MSDKTTEIQNKEGRNEKNADGSPVQEVKKDGEPKLEVPKIETVSGAEKNDDETPVKEVAATA